MRFVFKRKGKTLGSIGRSPDAGGSIDRQIPIEVVDDQEAELCDFVVCVPDQFASKFTDDIHTTCADCKTPIHHRPYAPYKPPKICMDCYEKRMLAESPQTARTEAETSAGGNE